MEGTYLDIVCTVSISDAINTGVNVDIYWFHNDGSPVTNNSDYTISSLTMLGSHVYTSTLRIEILNNFRDNGTVYSCTVSVLSSPVSSYIISNENNKTLPLIVSGTYKVIFMIMIYRYFVVFNSDHVATNIIFPTTPTAGDQFTMTCNISIPERLIHEPSSLIWSYDLAREQRVEVINNDASLGNVTRINNFILITLTLNPVKTSDGRRYYCSSIFNNLRVIDHTYRELNVQSEFI